MTAQTHAITKDNSTNKNPMTQYVLGFAFNPKKTHVLLILKKRPDWQAGLLNGIGGKIESFDTNPLSAMIREFKEETGLVTTDNQWKQFATMGNDYFSVSCFWAIADYLDLAESITDETVHYLPIAHLTQNNFKDCVSNLSWLINMALDLNIKDNFYAHIEYK
jgi:8-oxo-dGTP diphosphatase